jgi:hypothetical protein
VDVINLAPRQIQYSAKTKERKKMNTRKSVTIVLASVIVLALLIAGSASAKASDARFECGEGLYETTAPGNWAFPDGNVHIRGMQQIARVDCPDSRQVGYNYLTINANWDANFHGPMWGTFTFISDEGGSWTGTWNGQMTENGSWYNAVGNGQGIYAGMKLWIDKGFETTRGRILVTGGD